MPQYQDFGFQPPARLEAVGQHPDEKKGNCDHQPQSCSDSVAAVIPRIEFSEATGNVVAGSVSAEVLGRCPGELRREFGRAKVTVRMKRST
jgi:hypothetical protein